MKLGGALLMSKKGELLALATDDNQLSPSFAKALAQEIHSHLLYLFRKNQPIEVCYRLYGTQHCLISVNKDSIIVILAHYYERFVAYELLKRLLAFVQKQAKPEVLTKKRVEVTAVLEQALLSRQLLIKEPEITPRGALSSSFPRKRPAAQQIFLRMPQAEQEKACFSATLQKYASKKQISRLRIELTRQFCSGLKLKREQSQYAALSKQQTSIKEARRKAMLRLVATQAKKVNEKRQKKFNFKKNEPTSETSDKSDKDKKIKIGKERIQLPNAVLQEKVAIKIVGSEFKEVGLGGHLVLDGERKHDLMIELKGEPWNDKELIQKRVCVGLSGCRVAGPQRLQLQASQEQGAVRVLEYVCHDRCLDKARLPLYFKYDSRMAGQDFQFVFMFKVNPIKDIQFLEIEVHLNQMASFADLKTTPLAVSFQGKRALWKARSIAAGATGNLSLQLMSVNLRPEEVVRAVKVVLTASIGIMEQMTVQVSAAGKTQQATRQTQVQYLIQI